MSLTILRFALGPHQCGLPVLGVREVLRVVAMTPVPEGPPFLEGVIDLRGMLLPVIDLRKRFNLEATPFDSETRILVTEMHGHPAGLIVDEVLEVAPIDSAHMGIDLSDSLGIELRSVNRVVQVEGRIIIVLDLDKVLTPEEFNQLQRTRREVA